MQIFSQAFNFEYVLKSSVLIQSDKLQSHPWSHVMIGMWRKYPNPHCTHVVTVDVLDRTVDPMTGIIRTERILGCKQKAPSWIVKVPSPLRILFFKYVWLKPFSATRRFRGRIRQRGVIHRPCEPDCNHRLCQFVPLPICLMLRTNTLRPHLTKPDIVFANGGNPSTDGSLAQCYRQGGEVACATV
jgi:hypothetical protein